MMHITCKIMWSSFLKLAMKTSKISVTIILLTLILFNGCAKKDSPSSPSSSTTEGYTRETMPSICTSLLEITWT